MTLTLKIGTQTFRLTFQVRIMHQHTSGPEDNLLTNIPRGFEPPPCPWPGREQSTQCTTAASPPYTQSKQCTTAAGDAPYTQSTQCTTAPGPPYTQSTQCTTAAGPPYTKSGCKRFRLQVQELRKKLVF